MTVAEVAAHIGVGYRTVRSWVDRGLIPVAARDSPSRRRRDWVRRADVRAFAERYYRGKPRPAWLDEPD